MVSFRQKYGLFVNQFHYIVYSQCCQHGANHAEFVSGLSDAVISGYHPASDVLREEFPANTLGQSLTMVTLQCRVLAVKTSCGLPEHPVT
jgi:hypothetical protein